MNFIYIRELMHMLSQALLTPVTIVLLLLVLVVLYIAGSFLVEIIAERRHFKPKMPEMLAKLMGADISAIPDVIENSGMLKRHKQALLTLYENREYPEDPRMALVDRLLKEQDDKFQKRIGRTDLMAKICPMLGLMATLIPLGPGIVALGQGDITTLSASLMVAFDATVTGLVVAVVALAISKLRKRWYANYMNALKNAFVILMSKLEEEYDYEEV